MRAVVVQDSIMRTLSADLLRTLVRNFSHGACSHFDPETQMGCQRESFRDLGFGWIYWALSRVLEPRKVLVIGSGRGFAVACLSLGVEHLPDAEVLFVDPGYENWSVEGIQDIAAGMWQTPEQAENHFAALLGLGNIRFLRLRSDDAFERFQRDGDRFDLVFVDGEHSFRQALADLRNAAHCLNPGGLVLAHDTCCAHWPGVALALEALTAEQPWLERLSLPSFPGLSVLKKREPLVQIRPVTMRENDTINTWRVAVGATPRPLPHGQDPRPEVQRADPREGLFGVLEGGQLIGGFGIYQRTFDDQGPDNFRPDACPRLAGPLRYGAILRPEFRGKRRWQMVTCELLRWFAGEGFYTITRNPLRGQDAPYRFERVGAAGEYTAFHWQAFKTSDTQVDSPGLPEHAWRQVETLALREEVAEHHRRNSELATELSRVSRELHELKGSTSWRWTRTARTLGAWARTIRTKIRRVGSRAARPAARRANS